VRNDLVADVALDVWINTGVDQLGLGVGVDRMAKDGVDQAALGVNVEAGIADLRLDDDVDLADDRIDQTCLHKGPRVDAAEDGVDDFALGDWINAMIEQLGFCAGIHDFTQNAVD